MIPPCALFLSLALASPAGTLVVVTTDGFEDTDVELLRNKVDAEVASLGGKGSRPTSASETTEACIRDAACVRERVAQANASFLLWVDVLRAGPRAQVSSGLYDAQGAVVQEEERKVGVADILGPSPLLGERMRTSFSSSTSVASAPDGVALPPSGAVGVTTPGAPRDAALQALGVVGITAIGAGALLGLGGAALIPGQLEVIRDAGALGPEKEAAASGVVGAGVAAGVGALALVTGVVLVVLDVQH